MSTKRSKIESNMLPEDQAAIELEAQKRMAAHNSTEKSNNPGQSLPKITTNDVAETIEQSIDLSPGDITRPELAAVTGEDMNSPGIQEHAKILAFMNELVTFIVARTGMPDELEVLDVACNGEKKLIKRGEQVTLPRKFLNALIGSVTNVETKQYRDEQGLDQTRIDTATAPFCPISIIKDESNYFNGAEWFSHTVKHGG